MFYIHADILFDWIWHVLLGGSSKLLGASGEGHIFIDLHSHFYITSQTVAFLYMLLLHHHRLAHKLFYNTCLTLLLHDCFLFFCVCRKYTCTSGGISETVLFWILIRRLL